MSLVFYVETTLFTFQLKSHCDDNRPVFPISEEFLKEINLSSDVSRQLFAKLLCVKKFSEHFNYTLF